MSRIAVRADWGGTRERRLLNHAPPTAQVKASAAANAAFSKSGIDPKVDSSAAVEMDG
jgi:hypothetical protein